MFKIVFKYVFFGVCGQGLGFVISRVQNMAPKLNFEVMSVTCNIIVGYAGTNVLGSRTS
jgi:hypothetical protein